MKFPYSVLLFLTSCFGLGEVKKKPADAPESSSSFYDLKIQSIDGKEIDFSAFKGKKVLLVNTASKCGFTPQYKDLQKFHEQYGEKVVVIGFPSNDFKEQEPGSEEDIAQFCKKNYGVTFLLTEKVKVKGDDKHPVYEWLTDPSKNGWCSQEPVWNFCKYLVDDNGKLFTFYGSAVSPLNKIVQKDIQKLDSINIQNQNLEK